MRFKIGDYVLIRYTREKGYVVNADDDGNYSVAVEGDVLDLNESDLLPYETNYDPFKNFKREKTADEIWLDGDKPQSKTIKEEIAGRGDQQILFALEPYDEKVYGHQCYRINLVNTTANTVKFHVELYLKNELSFKHRGELKPDQHFYLVDLFQDQLNDSPKLEIELDWVESRKPVKISDALKLKVQKFLHPTQESPVLKTQAYLFEIYKKPEEIVTEKIDVSKLNTAQLKEAMLHKETRHSIRVGTAHPELDLHIEKLTKDSEWMNEGEMLDLQLRVFDQQLERAIAGYMEKWKVIHGQGVGKLRQLIHHKLKHHPGVKSFTNKSDIEHANGGITYVYF